MTSPRLARKPRKDVEQENFIRLYGWLKGEGDSFSELLEKMKELAKSRELYSLKWFNQKLIDKYKDLFLRCRGKTKCVVLRRFVEQSDKRPMVQRKESQ